MNRIRRSFPKHEPVSLAPYKMVVSTKTSEQDQALLAKLCMMQPERTQTSGTLPHISNRSTTTSASSPRGKISNPAARYVYPLWYSGSKLATSHSLNTGLLLYLQFFLAYRSLCPSAWCERWDDQRGKFYLSVTEETTDQD